VRPETTRSKFTHSSDLKAGLIKRLRGRRESPRGVLPQSEGNGRIVRFPPKAHIFATASYCTSAKGEQGGERIGDETEYRENFRLVPRRKKGSMGNESNRVMKGEK